MLTIEKLGQAHLLCIESHHPDMLVLNPAILHSPGVRAEVAPGKRLDAFVSCRPMWLAERTDAFASTGVRDASGKAGSFAGHQLEGRVRYWVVPGFLRSEINALWLAKGRFLKTAPNAPPTGDTSYVSTAVIATF